MPYHVRMWTKAGREANSPLYLRQHERRKRRDGVERVITWDSWFYREPKHDPTTFIMLMTARAAVNRINMSWSKVRLPDGFHVEIVNDKDEIV